MLNRLPTLRPFRAWIAGPKMAAERFNVMTRDGVRLAIHRVPAPGGPAVMLLHGLGSNRHAFHFPGRSLAEYLAAHGFDCYLPELRGAGESERPRYDWWIDEYLQQDLPVIIDAIRAKTTHDRIHWVGHSLGGLLLLCYGILNPSVPVESGMAIGAGLDYRVGFTSFRHLLKIRVLLERIPAIPYGTAMHLMTPLLGRRLSSRVDALTAYPPNIEPDVMRRIQGTCFHTVPMTLLGSLATLFGRRGLRMRDRSTYFVEKAERFKIPLSLIGGTKDLQISAHAVQQTAQLVGGPAEVCIYGRQHGEQENYGHWDLIVGRRAVEEVWPSIVEWLERHAVAAAA